METIVIVGGVAAGATAAAKVRRMSPTAKIVMLEAGPDISFANCGLPYYIGGDIDSRSKLILQSPESFNEQYNVDVRTYTKVSSINSDAKSVSTENVQTGEKIDFEYDKLILAQGGRPIKPNLPGADSNHVLSLWTLEDMDKITDHLDNNNPKNAVVVGGGFIGLEMVEALAHRGLNVHVVEMMPHVMSLMDGEAAGFIEREMLSYGVGVHTNVGVTEIKSDHVVLSNGETLDAEIVIMSIGVRPTLQLAKDAGLELGEAGGLLVNDKMQTSNPDIFAAGDMVEIEHRAHGKKVRIPLAGPANRQGRIAAENALGGNHSYKGSIGTSVVRVFEAVAGITGLSLKNAKAMGLDADAVVVHKEHHTSYYPGSEPVSVMLVYDKNTGVVLGGQTAGYKGADKRLDVIATAVATKLTVSDLADIDFAYSPPIGTANDAMNMAAYVAENKMSGFSPSVNTSDLDAFLEGKDVEYIDLRDVFAFKKSKVVGATNIPLEVLSEKLSSIPKNKTIVLYDEFGKKGHQALRTLLGAGFEEVVNISGGHTSLQRFAQTVGFSNIEIEQLEIEHKTLDEGAAETEAFAEEQSEQASGPLVIDVRTRGEFAGGAYPDSLNIPLDELENSLDKIGSDLDREIVVYCASGARSSYAQRMLQQLGYNDVSNGGGLTTMMMRLQEEEQQEEQSTKEPEGKLVVDVRSRGEFSMGAYPEALNIPLDEIQQRIDDFGQDTSREIVVYCASGARSSYAQQFLMQMGYTNVRNGGGLMHMMMEVE